MAFFELAQSAYGIYRSRDKLWRILKWVLVAILSLLFILYMIITTVVAVIQGFSKASDTTQKSDLAQVVPFQSFNYKTIDGNNWYEFKHPYIFPTLGTLTQGVLDVSKDGLRHIAWDIADTPARATEVKAFSDGTVVAVNTNMLYNTTRRWKFCDSGVGICWYQVKEKADIQIGCGYEIIIQHQDSLSTQYCHLAAEPALQPGDTVTAGQTIGYQGSTGWATGKHLHFALWRGGQPIDPSYAFTQTSLSSWGP